MMRLHLSDSDEAVIMALGDQPRDFGFLSFAAIARRGVPAHNVRRVVRKLARMGITQFASGLWNDDGEPRGAGYGLTDYGWALAQAIEARRDETQSGSVHESAVAESDAPETRPTPSTAGES